MAFLHCFFTYFRRSGGRVKYEEDGTHRRQKHRSFFLKEFGHSPSSLGNTSHLPLTLVQVVVRVRAADVINRRRRHRPRGMRSHDIGASTCVSWARLTMAMTCLLPELPDAEPGADSFLPPISHIAPTRLPSPFLAALLEATQLPALFLEDGRQRREARVD